MQRPTLDGRSILIVEDEPLIVMDITQAFDGTGAELTTTNALRHALILVEHDGLSGAILDHALGNDDSSLLCARLKERGIPFMIYSGFDSSWGRVRGCSACWQTGCARAARGSDGKPHLRLRPRPFAQTPHKELETWTKPSHVKP